MTSVTGDLSLPGVLTTGRRGDIRAQRESGTRLHQLNRKTAAPHTFPFSTEQSMFRFLFSFNPEERLGIFCSQLLYKSQFI